MIEKFKDNATGTEKELRAVRNSNDHIVDMKHHGDANYIKTKDAVIKHNIKKAIKSTLHAIR